MKYLKYMIIFSTVLSTACSNWLDVSPGMEKEKRDALASQDGIRKVLIGAYIRMKTEKLYGKEMTYGFTECLAQHWQSTSTTSLSGYLKKYDYKAKLVEDMAGDIFNNLYKVIADVNGLLVDDGIDAHKEVLEADNYELIKGEALAVRAFCHFDLLRLFGPMPDKIPAGQILPYVTVVSKNPNAMHSWEEFTSYLLKDLDEAEKYFEKTDPICNLSLEKLNNPASTVEDRFMYYRQMRMNYYAVCALKARIYLWMGDKKQALKYAKMVIAAKDKEGKPMYRLGNSNDVANLDYTLSSEHIFNLNVYNLESTLGSSKEYQMSKNELFRHFYEKGTTDIRFTNLWEEVTEGYYKKHYLKKYRQTERMPEMAKNSIPLIRLYEMYLIAMECGDLTEANALYKEMCMARNTPQVEIKSTEQLNKILILEYNKEFYGEGQAFYAYKRLGVEDIFYTTEKGSVDTYIVPLPLQEKRD